MNKELVKKLIEEDMIYFFLGSLVSSDSLNNKTDYEESIKILNDTRLVLIDLDAENKEKYIQYIENEISILKSEYNTLQL